MKLMGWNYVIQYKKDEITSQRTHCQQEMNEEAERSNITATIVPLWVQEIQNSYEEDEEASKLLIKLAVDWEKKPPHSYEQGLLRQNGRLYVGRKGELRRKLLQANHESFKGSNGTYNRLKKGFFTENEATGKQIDNNVTPARNAKGNNCFIQDWFNLRLL